VLSYIISFICLTIFVIPLSWEFFLHIKDNNLKPIPLFFEAKISEYLIFYINLYYFCFITCLLSFLFFFFASNFSKNITQIKNLRKIVYYIFFIISTLTTPPDVFSQIILSFILISIYEIIVFLKLLSNF
jgi:sec-independent protein translocase protein TatC